MWSPPSSDNCSHLPPDLCQLKYVNDGLREPDEDPAAAPGSSPGARPRQHPGRGSAASAPLAAALGAEVALLRSWRRHHGRRSRAALDGFGEIVGEPSEAQHLHDHGRDYHKDQSQCKAPVVTP